MARTISSRGAAGERRAKTRSAALGGARRFIAALPPASPHAAAARPARGDDVEHEGDEEELARRGRRAPSSGRRRPPPRPSRRRWWRTGCAPSRPRLQRDDGGVARGHQHDHRLADGAAEARARTPASTPGAAAGSTTRQAVSQRRRPQRQRGLAVAARAPPRSASSLTVKIDRDDGERQRHPGHHRVEPVGEAEDVLQPGGQHHQGEEAEHHRGDAGEQLDGRLEHLAQAPRRELGGEERRGHAQRHRDEHARPASP